MADTRILNSRYTLEAEIGRGGMGVVYRADDAQVKRTVAIKTLPSIMTHNTELMRRFNSEVQHASKLSHPNIARVYDVGEDAGTHYYVMQYIDGKSLRELLKEKGRFTLEEALPILEQVASALDYAHSQGIVHRDIKPENILLDKVGNAYVVDFGIAKAAEGTRTTRGMLGTPEYMSPEQIRGEAVDGRSDQYSLAVVAYEMLTGRTPFQTVGDDPWAQMNKHLISDPQTPRAIAPALTDVSSNALLKGLEKVGINRFQSCNELVSAIQGSIAFNLPPHRKNNLFYPILIGVAILIISSLVIINHRFFNKDTNPSATNDKSGSTSISHMENKVLFIDTTTPKMSALCIVNADGTGLRRIGWVNGNIEFFAYNAKVFGGNLINDVSGELERVDITNDLSEMICSVTRESFSKTTKSDLECLVAISPDGHYLLYYGIDSYGMMGETNNTYGLYLYDVNSQGYKKIDSFQLEHEGGASWTQLVIYNNPRPLFTHDGRDIVYSHMDGSLYVAECSTGNSRKVGKLGIKPDFLCVSPANKTVLSAWKSGKISLTNLSDGSTKDIEENYSNVTAIDIFDSDIYVAHDRTVSWLSVEQNMKGTVLAKISSAIENLQVNTDNTMLAIGDTDNTICVYDKLTKRTTNMAHGKLLGWVNVENSFGEEVRQTTALNGVVGLPKSNKIIDSLIGDIDGNGKAENVYHSSGTDGSWHVWATKNDKVFWTMPSEDISSCTSFRIELKDVTGDKQPDVIVAYDEGGRNTFYYAYGCVGKTMKKLTDNNTTKMFFASDKFMVKPAIGEKPLQYVVVRSDYEPIMPSGTYYYQWNGYIFSISKQEEYRDQEESNRYLKSLGYTDYFDKDFYK